MADREGKRNSGLGNWLLAAALGAAVLVWLRAPNPANRLAGPESGDSALPDLAQVEGWLNVPAGATAAALSEQFRNGLLVVDCWATWCGPCRAALPELARVHEAYRPRGVQFVGLTQEPAAALSKIEGVIGEVPGFTWPVGYGAGDFMDRMGIQGIPTLILFDQGRAVWAGLGAGAVDDLAAELDSRLARG